MFERFKKALLGHRSAGQRHELAAGAVSSLQAPASEWASAQGFVFSAQGSEGFDMRGTVQGRPWRIEVGRPSRSYIHDAELRARAELDIDEDVAVLIMNRVLKESLDKQAYSLYTDDLQTIADPKLPEEMRWLAMYEEVAWDSLPENFWTRYCVLSDHHENALAMVDPVLAQLMLDWPDPAPTPEVPFVFMLLRGKAYLRMEHGQGGVPTLEHASHVFLAACEAALGTFRPRA